MRSNRATLAGAYVTIVGPDGTGKSTLAANIERRSPFARCTRAHWRPGLLPPLGGKRRAASTEMALPHGKAVHGRLATAARLVYYWSDFVLGYWLRIRSRVRSGELYLLERGWSDMLVDRRRYRLSPLPHLEGFLDRLVPRPDLTLFLDVPPQVVLHRKNELTEAELERQRAVWRELATHRPEVVPVNGERTVDSVLESALGILMSGRARSSTS